MKILFFCDNFHQTCDLANNKDADADPFFKRTKSQAAFAI
jgi:hypothetical protein